MPQKLMMATPGVQVLKASRAEKSPLVARRAARYPR